MIVDTSFVGWTWMTEDFSKAPGVKDLNKMKSQYVMFVDPVVSEQVTQMVCVCFITTQTYCEPI